METSASGSPRSCSASLPAAVEHSGWHGFSGAPKLCASSSTGGRYYPLSKLGDVPDDAQYVEGETSFVEQRELWDVPFLFMLLCMTLGAEWFWRKRKGLA